MPDPDYYTVPSKCCLVSTLSRKSYSFLCSHGQGFGGRMHDFIHNPTGRLQTRTRYDTGRGCIGPCDLPSDGDTVASGLGFLLALAPPPLFPISSSLTSHRLMAQGTLLGRVFTQSATGRPGGIALPYPRYGQPGLAPIPDMAINALRDKQAAAGIPHPLTTNSIGNVLQKAGPRV